MTPHDRPDHRCQGVYSAFVDETRRDPTYGLAAAIVCRCELNQVRKVVRLLVRPGQRRVHFSKEQDRGRKAFLSAVVRTPVRAVFVSAVGHPTVARSQCWTTLVPELLARGVDNLRIEHVDGSEERDRQDIRRALAVKGDPGMLTYRHESAAAEPLLWVADAVAWSASASPEWRARVAPILTRF